jgi:hypothetical protein
VSQKRQKRIVKFGEEKKIHAIIFFKKEFKSDKSRDEGGHKRL